VPIPQLSEHGFLPDGIHECTIEEILTRFARFQDSDCRPALGRELEAYVGELRSAKVGKYLVVDGSFVSGEPAPSDIDLVLVLQDDISLAGTLPPFQYNARSRKYVRRNYRFDLFPVLEGDGVDEMISFFRQVKHHPGEVKGMLKVVL